jgi:ubiquinone/menaquinone biosynthesis C-methylase UbiE
MTKESKNFYTAKSFYRNEVVRNYNKERTTSTKWKREQKEVEKIISSFPANSTFLDLPIGTGRLLPLFQKYDQKVYGVDISKDMLNYIKESELNVSSIIELIEGDAENIPLPTNSVDAVFCLRLLNLVPINVCTNIIREFTRVSAGDVIFQVRVNQKVSLLTLFIKILSDPRTHLNRMAAYLIKLVKQGFYKSENSNQNAEITDQSYFVHDFEEISKQLEINKLTVKQILEIDKGIDYSKGTYIPFLIIRCSQNL